MSDKMSDRMADNESLPAEPEALLTIEEAVNRFLPPTGRVDGMAGSGWHGETGTQGHHWKARRWKGMRWPAVLGDP